MTKMEEIEQEIKKLESKNLTYDIVNKLAMLYTVRDHMAGTGASPRMPMPGPTAPNVMK